MQVYEELGTARVELLRWLWDHATEGAATVDEARVRFLGVVEYLTALIPGNTDEIKAHMRAVNGGTSWWKDIP